MWTLCFLKWCSIIMINKASSLSIMCFSGAGIYFCVFSLPVCLSVCGVVTDELCHREENTQSVATGGRLPKVSFFFIQTEIV